MGVEDRAKIEDLNTELRECKFKMYLMREEIDILKAKVESKNDYIEMLENLILTFYRKVRK